MGSNPGLSTPEHGKRLFEESVKGMTALYQQLPNAGVNANCTSSAPSLVTGTVECAS